MLRSGWPDAESFDRASYLAQQAAFHSRTHKQADDLSFIWYDRGAVILIDAGSYGFLGRTESGSDLWNKGFWYSDPKRIYVESTRSHNTVEIDGMSFNRRESPPYGSAIERWGETEDGLLFVETHALQFETVGHTRLLVLDPGNWLLVYDWLSDEAGAEHDFRQWFHFAPDLTVETQNGELRVSGRASGRESVRRLAASDSDIQRAGFRPGRTRSARLVVRERRRVRANHQCQFQRPKCEARCIRDALLLRRRHDSRLRLSENRRFRP